MGEAVRLCDAGGAVKAWINADPVLCGRGRPLTNGILMSEPRSNTRGTYATIQEIDPRETRYGRDDARVSLRVRGVGSEPGARAQVERAARLLRDKVTALTRPVTVTTGGGETVTISHVFDPAGPVLTGDVGGELEYRVDVTVRCEAH